MISYKLFNKISFYNFLKGMAMGVSDLIPGISGGTVALLLGIYDDFINSAQEYGTSAAWRHAQEGAGHFLSLIHI